MSQELDPDWEEGEPETSPFGQGDGATTHFSGWRRGDMIPGSVLVRVISDDAVSKLGLLHDPTACFAACHDINKDGVLYGDVLNAHVNYQSGQVEVTFNHAPPMDYKIELIAARYVNRLRDHKVQLRSPSGDMEWVTLKQFGQALAML